MGIKLHHADAFVGKGVNDTHHRAIAHGVFAAQHERQATAFSGGPSAFANTLQNIARLAPAVHCFLRVNTQAAGFAVQLVVGFELVGGFNDGRRAFRRAATVADGLFIRYGYHMKQCVIRRRLTNFRAEKDTLCHKSLA